MENDRNLNYAKPILKSMSNGLTAFAKSIRRHENKLKRNIDYQKNTGNKHIDELLIDDFYFFHNKRTYELRNESRAVFLTRAFIEKRSYHSIEQREYNEIDPMLKTWTFRNSIIPKMISIIVEYEIFNINWSFSRNANNEIVKLATPESKQFIEKELMNWFLYK